MLSDERMDLPQQINNGDGAVQIGQVGGNVLINQITHQTVIYHQPFALQPPPAPPALRRKNIKASFEITIAQKELLALMKPLPAHVRIQVLDYMRSEFGTGMVMELDPRELHRTRQQVMDARRSVGI